MSTQAGRVIRWGVIGVGDVVEHKSGRAFQTVPGSALVAVMRRDAERAADFARRFGVPRWYADADELLADPEVDAVYVATPPDSHAAYTARAAAAGKPVYVEKPMARTGSECEQMISDCARAGVPLFVAYYRRAMPRFATAAELVRSGRIGAVRSVVVRHQRPADDRGGPLPWRLDPPGVGRRALRRHRLAHARLAGLPARPRHRRLGCRGRAGRSRPRRRRSWPGSASVTSWASGCGTTRRRSPAT